MRRLNFQKSTRKWPSLFDGIYLSRSCHTGPNLRGHQYGKLLVLKWRKYKLATLLEERGDGRDAEGVRRRTPRQPAFKTRRLNICKTLRVSRATLYHYVGMKSSGVKIESK